MTKTIKKNVTKDQQLARDITATPYGSLVKTYLILNGMYWNASKFVGIMKKGKFPYLEDEDFIKKTLEAVGLDYKNLEGKPVAVCKDNYNTIFCPFIVGTDTGEVVLLPLFKDRTLLRSQQLAMANDTYSIIDWSTNL